MNKIQVAFFDSKDYDRDIFNRRVSVLGLQDQLDIKYFEFRLNAQTVNVISKNIDVICSFVNDQIDIAVIRRLKRAKVRLIALRCAGFNHVDMAGLAGDIPVVRVPAYSPNAVAEYALSLMCTLNRKTHKAYQRVREGNFSIQGLVGFNFYHKNAGIIGTGKIGRAMIKILQGLGMDIFAYDPFPDYKLHVKYTSLEQLYENSDIISLHCPLTQETKHMINYSALAMMKSSVLIINTSRGGLINTEDLIYALKKDNIGGAGLDVYEEEEEVFFEDHSSENLHDEQLIRLMGFNNVILTSHQAFLTQEALTNIADTTLQNIIEYIVNDRLQNAITFP